MSTLQDYPKWQTQIEELASHFELDVISNQRIFEHYKSIVKGNSKIDVSHGYRFHRWVEHNHYYAVLAALRKIFFNTDKNEFSLLKIINELLGSGNVVTRRNYPAHIGVDGTNLIGAAAATSASTGFFASNGQLSTGKLEQDKSDLEAMSQQLSFINERVLHIQKNPKALPPSDNELVGIVKKLSDMLEGYRLFLTGHHTAWSIEDFSWGEIFTQPWMPGDTRIGLEQN